MSTKSAAKLFAAYVQMIRTDTLGESHIRALRLHLAKAYDSARDYSTARVCLDTSQASALLDEIYAHNPRISPEQSAKGIAWLRNQHKTPSGRVRKNSPFANDWRVTVLETFEYFTLTDLEDVSTAVRSFFLPVYRVHGRAPETAQPISFAYIAGAWQSGFGIEFR